MDLIRVLDPLSHFFSSLEEIRQEIKKGLIKENLCISHGAVSADYSSAQITEVAFGNNSRATIPKNVRFISLTMTTTTTTARLESQLIAAVGI